MKLWKKKVSSEVLLILLAIMFYFRTYYAYETKNIQLHWKLFITMILNCHNSL